MLAQLPLVPSTTFRRSSALVRPASLSMLLFSLSQLVNDYPSLWVHVDAAWAGVACSCPEFREMCYLDTINEFVDSFCTNWHKVGDEYAFSFIVYHLTSRQWGLVNFDASGLWVRDRKQLTDALDVSPPFLRTKQGDSGLSLFFPPTSALFDFN